MDQLSRFRDIVSSTSTGCPLYPRHHYLQIPQTNAQETHGASQQVWTVQLTPSTKRQLPAALGQQQRSLSPDRKFKVGPGPPIAHGQLLVQQKGVLPSGSKPALLPSLKAKVASSPTHRSPEHPQPPPKLKGQAIRQGKKASEIVPSSSTVEPLVRPFPSNF